MKKLIFLLILFSLAVYLNAQLGDGSSGNPFHGTITTSVQWTPGNPVFGSTVYIGTSSDNDLIVGSGGQLTIDPGITVIFTQLTSDLKITGTGILTADGNSANPVTFTKATDKANWGHISFEGSTGNSVIDNCIIEFGLKTGAGVEGYGGGIHINTSNLTVSNSEIRNNRSTFGGGIFVNQNVSPVITNCKILNNRSNSSGGGLYSWIGSATLITNCIINGNQSLGGGGGGGLFLGRNCGNVRIVNSTIVANTAAGPGKNIHLYINTDVARPSFINCIIWSPANSISYTTQTPSATDFVNCAIQNPVTGSTTNSISLNSINTNPAGPNFVATDGSDWSITNLSPCRDAGVDSYPGVTIPATDYAGRNRVSPFDIGAYEVYLFSRWKISAASTIWSDVSNWDGGVPTSSSDVVIPTGATNYPTGSPAQDFIIGTGNFMNLEPGSRVTLNALTNNGILRLNSSSGGFASLLVNSYTRGAGGNEEIQLYLSGGGNDLDDNFKWHYISTPVSSLDVSIFAPGTTYNLAQWIESRPTGSLLEGWVAFDGYIYPSGGMGGTTFSTLTPGKGFDYFDDTDHTFTFSGTFNTGDVTANLGYAGVPSIHGFNLLGNPFSSGLDWDYIITHSYPANTSRSLYFTRDNVQCTYASGVGIPGDVTGIIPPMQGFFTKTYSTGNSIILAAAARTQSNIHDRYKGKATIPLVRLAITDNSMTDETVVRFDNEAKADLDYDFDAVRMSVSSSKTYLYTLIADIKYAINGQPFPQDTVEIPLVVNVTSTGNHTISATQIQGLDGYNVTLTDNSNSNKADLKKTPQLTFTSPSGTFTDRFVINVSKMPTGIENPATQDTKFNIYHSTANINIQTISDEWEGKTGMVRVLDLAGKTVKDMRNAEFSKNSLLTIPASGMKGVYFVEVKSGTMRYVGKVVVR